jgi:hypothetical protein
MMIGGRHPVAPQSPSVKRRQLTAVRRCSRLLVVRDLFRVVVDAEQDHCDLEEDAVDQDHDDERQASEDESSEESAKAATTQSTYRHCQPHKAGHHDHHDVDDLHDRWCDERLKAEVK